MRVTSEVLIFVKTDLNMEDNVARTLKSSGFTVRITQRHFDFNIVIQFDARHKHIDDLKNEIESVNGVTGVIILPSYPA